MNQLAKQKQRENYNTRHRHAMMECMSVCAACSKNCIEEGHNRTASLCVQYTEACTAYYSLR